MTGAELIAGERARQQFQCGWTKQHDLETHSDGQLRDEAISILLCHTHRSELVDEFSRFGLANKDKINSPDSKIRAFAIAGALIAAEIDRLLGIERGATT